ncbi:MAG: hypothetical protein BWK79_13425, partial [Beggiatoa sp. IS2]
MQNVLKRVFKNLKLGYKLLVFFVISGLVPLGIVGYLVWYQGHNILLEQAFGQLENVREIKKSGLEDFFEERQKDTHALVNTLATLEQSAFQKLQIAQENKKAQLESFFQECLNDIRSFSKIDSVSQALEQFDGAFKVEGLKTDGLGWQSIEERFGAELKQYKDEQGYYNLLLIAKDGNVVYSAIHGADLGQNVLTGSLKESPLHSAFQQGLTGIAIQDFMPYSMADNQYTAFISAPLSRFGENIGVLILSLTVDQVDAIAQRRKGMGLTGESYLIGQLNGVTSYRSNRKSVNAGKEFKIGEERRHPEINKALAGQEGISIRLDIKGELVISAYSPVTIPGLNWCLISNVQLEEALIQKLSGNQADILAEYANQYGYYDLFLIHPQGKIFYTIKHEKDYNTNILEGEYSNTQLSRVLQESLKSKMFSLSDFSLYLPSDNKPVMFMAEPLLYNNEIELILAVQLDQRNINEITHQRTNTYQDSDSETYLVGDDYLMRSDSIVNQEYTIFNSFNKGQKINTESVHAALRGETGRKITQNYRGETVLSTYAPIKVGNKTWAIISEVTEAQAMVSIKHLELFISLITIGVTLAILILARLLTPIVTRPLNRLVEVSEAVTAGNLDNIIEIDGKDEINQLLQTFSRMQTQLRTRIFEDKRIADEALRINNALDNATTAVLISDNNYNIIYINQAARTLFKTEAHKIRTELPTFDPDHLIGKNVDSFHRNPSYQRQLLGELTVSRRARVTIGKVILDHIITPVINDKNETIGMIVEFTNRTTEVATEGEINTVIQAALQGHFEQRINLQEKTGFFKVFCESINQIMESNQRALDDTLRMFGALAKGDLTESIQSEYVGAFEKLKSDANATVKQLIEIMTTIQQTTETVSGAAQEISQGNASLSQRTEEQAASLEETAASMEQMTATVQRKADNAKQANQLAMGAKDRAVRGGDVVNATILAMTEISQSS